MDENPYRPSQADPLVGQSPSSTDRALLLGRCALLMACISSIWLLIAVAHVRSDRTNRIPVITSEGPLAGHIATVAWAALGGSGVAMVIAWIVIEKSQRSHKSAAFAILISGLNFVATIFVWLALFED
jgi:hypothetical protein